MFLDLYFEIQDISNNDAGKDTDKMREIERMSDDEYDNLVYDELMKTKENVDAYMDYGKKIGVCDIDEMKKRTTEMYDKIRLVPCEAYILASNRKDITEEFFMDNLRSGKMCIINVKFKEDNLEYDVESDIKYWLDDSKKILNDKYFDNPMKIRTLPVRNMFINLGGVFYELYNCKIIEDYERKNVKYHFAVLVEKILKKR